LIRTALATALAGLAALAPLLIFAAAWGLQILALLVFLLAYFWLGKALGAVLPYDVDWFKSLLSSAVKSFPS